ncbi:MAG: hypothetical protein ACW9XH_07975 [Candidatus Nitrosopumilus sp. bin_32a]
MTEFKEKTFEETNRLVTELFEKYGDVKIIAKQLGISTSMAKKIIKFSRLPKLIKENLDSININQKVAIDCAIRSADALAWSKDSGVPEEKVFELAKAYSAADQDLIIDTIPVHEIRLVLEPSMLKKIESLCKENAMSAEEFAMSLIEEGLDHFGELEKIDAFWKGHLSDEGGIIGDAYEFEGNSFEIIVIGDNKGIYKNDKKMKKTEYDQLPSIFKMTLRLEPEFD